MTSSPGPMPKAIIPQNGASVPESCRAMCSQIGGDGLFARHWVADEQQDSRCLDGGQYFSRIVANWAFRSTMVWRLWMTADSRSRPMKVFSGFPAHHKVDMCNRKLYSFFMQHKARQMPRALELTELIAKLNQQSVSPELSSFSRLPLPASRSQTGSGRERPARRWGLDIARTPMISGIPDAACG